MLSMPPATTTLPLPARRPSLASITAFMPEPHILLSVVAGTASGRPAAKPACRAGAWPWPAGSTQPIRSSSTSAGGRPGALQRGADGDAAELGRRGGRERALEAAHRGAGGGDDHHGVGHLEPLQAGPAPG